jgi:hypothetical protein
MYFWYSHCLCSFGYNLRRPSHTFSDIWQNLSFSITSLSCSCMCICYRWSEEFCCQLVVTDTFNKWVRFQDVSFLDFSTRQYFFMISILFSNMENCTHLSSARCVIQPFILLECYWFQIVCSTYPVAVITFYREWYVSSPITVSIFLCEDHHYNFFLGLRMKFLNISLTLMWAKPFITWTESLWDRGSKQDAIQAVQLTVF